jgi:hypothetical protein
LEVKYENIIQRTLCFGSNDSYGTGDNSKRIDYGSGNITEAWDFKDLFRTGILTVTAR